MNEQWPKIVNCVQYSFDSKVDQMVCIKFHATTAASFLLVIQFVVQIQCKELNLLAGLFDTMGNLLHPRSVRDLYELKTVTTIVKSHLFFD